ncbi:MAG: type II/IV secretion system ATPase subunit, partial [Nanoarchaeota archaeon]|nr:type II/IV secretion system ATPase subunit [Nanoarchaeota archaeon]
MSKRGKVTRTQQKVETAQSSYPHFRDYMKKLPKELANPKYLLELDRSMRDLDPLNIIYPVGDALFVHIFRPEGKPLQYVVIEPTMDESTDKIYQKVLDRLVEIAFQQEKIDVADDITPILVNLLNDVVVIDTKTFFGSSLSSKIHLNQQQYDIIKYFLLRERVGYSKLEPLFNDPYLEDIHCTGIGHIKAVHKIFQAVRMNIDFSNDLELNKYILETSERVERPVSDARPVVDAVMPDGSRVNFIYGREISREGSSFTVR